MPFTISLATPSDAAAIAHVFQSNETDSFLRLQLGTVDPEVMTQGLTERLAENISKPDTVYVVARDDETGEIMSFASWTLPRGRDEEFVTQSDEVGWQDFSRPLPLCLPFCFSRGCELLLVCAVRRRLEIVRNFRPDTEYRKEQQPQKHTARSSCLA